MFLLALGAFAADVTELAALVAALGFGGARANRSRLHLIAVKRA